MTKTFRQPRILFRNFRPRGPGASVLPSREIDVSKAVPVEYARNPASHERS